MKIVLKEFFLRRLILYYFFLNILANPEPTNVKSKSNPKAMEELKKIHRISMREAGDSRVKVLLTIDATTGQNGISQAQSFQEAVHCDGVFLSKLDGSAKGGIALPIVTDVRLPILFVGTGESESDMALFDANQFVDSLIDPVINGN